MASFSDSESVAMKQTSKLYNFTTCSVCNNPYDASAHAPKLLPCLHSVCASCIGAESFKSKDDKRQFNCKVCNEVLVVPEQKKLQENFLVENLKEYDEFDTHKKRCTNFENCGGMSVSYCYGCAYFICQKCVDEHKKIKHIQKHRINTLEELRETKVNPIKDRKTMCVKHPAQQLEIYCDRPACEKPVCNTCALQSHRKDDHNLIELSEALEEATTKIQTESAKVSNNNHHLNQVSSSIDAAQESIKERYEAKEREIAEIAENMHQFINERKNEATTKLKQLYDDEKKRLEASKTKVGFLTAQITDACDFAYQACDNGDAVQILQSRKSIVTRLEQLKARKLPQEEPGTTQFVFGEGHDAARKEMTNALQKMCEVEKSGNAKSE